VTERGSVLRDSARFTYRLAAHSNVSPEHSSKPSSSSR
jgi:hypothetical protein